MLDHSLKQFLHVLSADKTGGGGARATTLAAASAAARVVFALRQALESSNDGKLRALAERSDVARHHLEEALQLPPTEMQVAQKDVPASGSKQPRATNGERETRVAADSLLDTAEKSLEVLDIALHTNSTPRAKASIELTSLITGSRSVQGRSRAQSTPFRLTSRPSPTTSPEPSTKPEHLESSEGAPG